MLRLAVLGSSTAEIAGFAMSTGNETALVTRELAGLAAGLGIPVGHEGAARRRAGASGAGAASAIAERALRYRWRSCAAPCTYVGDALSASITTIGRSRGSSTRPPAK